MPRTSTTALIASTPELPEFRLVPRSGMPDEVAEIFREIIAQVPADHFRRGDSYLIEAYAQAIVASRKSYSELQTGGAVTSAGKLNPLVAVLEKADRTICALSARLRLAPQQRTDPKTTGRQRFTPSAYGTGDNDDR